MWKRTVWSSMISANSYSSVSGSSTGNMGLIASEMSGSAICRWKASRIASEVTGVPSWNMMPGRSVTSQSMRLSELVIDSAR